MARKERVSKGRTMMPNYFVFCEGDTEVAYIEMLRSFYRLPIHIIAKKTLLNITPSLVERCKSAYVQTKNDRTYKRLTTYIRQYKKGALRADDRLYLLSSQKDAAGRAKKFKEYHNPSSTVYRLIDDLESLMLK